MFHQATDLSRGFLPATDPIMVLPELSKEGKLLALNKEINGIIRSLPQLLAEKKLREVIDQLEVTCCDQHIILEHHNVMQKKAAALFLSMIAQAYVFAEPANPPKEIPSVIAQNLYRIAFLGQRRPMLAYSEYALHNWYRIDPAKPVTLQNIQPIVTFTGTPDEIWFIKIHVAIEAVCIHALQAAKRIHACLIQTEKPYSADEIKKSFEIITIAMLEATELMHRMKDNCHADVFFHQLRQYWKGWDTIINETSGKKGVMLQGVDTGKNESYAYSGVSGAQSSIVPALDAILNIKQPVNSMFEQLDHFKSYMPREHQAIISNFGLCKTRRYVKGADNHALSQAYNEACGAVAKFRGAHLAVVHSYIYQQAKAAGINKEAIAGTGGAPASHYLSERLMTTQQHKLSM